MELRDVILVRELLTEVLLDTGRPCGARRHSFIQ